MLVKRGIFDKLLQEQKHHQISIIIGSRQVGKSTLLNQIQEHFNIPSLFLNFENPLHLKILNNGYNSFINEVGKDTKLVFIDEFHYYKNITSVFKAIFDLHPEIKIYATGSSSLEIHKHLKESLAGRKFETILYPFSFSEWLTSKNFELPSLSTPFSIIHHEKLKFLLNEFLCFGAMPGLFAFKNEKEKIEYLQSIYSAYILKDIKSFVKEERIIDFNKLIELIILTNGKILNENSLSKEARLNQREVNKYVDLLTQTFIVFLVKPFFTNKQKELIKSPKLYFYDTGIANMMLKNFSEINLRTNKGEILEQFVFLELLKSMDIRYNLKYWRTADKYEVDFILIKDDQLLPIEVKSLWETNKIPKGLIKFFDYYPFVKKGVILSLDTWNEFTYKDKTILCYPLYCASQLKELF